MTPKPSAPEVFSYHDYRAFLKDWFEHLKSSQPGFSLRALAKKAELAVGYLPMVLGGKRPLTTKALAKLMPHLNLSPTERSFLESLVMLGTSDEHEAHRAALGKMKRFSRYQKNHPKEAEVYEYLTHWYYVAIREMAALPGFKADPAWIQSRLRASVPLLELKGALDFLIKNGYIQVDEKGNALPLPSKPLDCTGDVFRVALAQFHREVFDLAAKSIQEVDRDHRNIQGHTLALSEGGFQKAQQILEEALDRVRKLGEQEKAGDSVYHMEIALFPMTQRAETPGRTQK